MKYLALIVFLGIPAICTLTSCDNTAVDWKPADCQLTTRWTAQVDPEMPWPEYPRPQMERDEWMNLNGLWDYTITDTASGRPAHYDGKILVPFPVESCLSGVGRMISPDEKIWYRREFTLSRRWNDRRILLNFEASDWRTTVWVNGQRIGRHEGGYDNFIFDITTALNKNGLQEIVVSVWDPSDSGIQPRGKQVNRPEGIFYTPCSGIWQTVWLEPVSLAYFSGFRMLPDLDSAALTIQPLLEYAIAGDEVEIEMEMPDGGIASKVVPAGLDARMHVPVLSVWSPSDPHLYGITARIIRDGKVLDEVKTYAALRKISLGKGPDGITRILLNNEFVFQNGPLDQGYWPDGIYTPPTEEAMLFDLDAIRKMGFNTLRKHVKVESRRYYYQCDRLGILVWQDMPSPFYPEGTVDADGNVPPEMAGVFEYELRRMIESHFNHPSIIMWVIFNEGWGQHRTSGLVSLVRTLDQTRLVSNASGWTDMWAGDILDVHHYPEPVAPEPDPIRALVLGEYGGLGFPVEGHTWVKDNWGYKKMTTLEELLGLYTEYNRKVRELKDSKGLNACIYTQTTDVETETNGLITYDREVIKMNADSLYSLNQIK